MTRSKLELAQLANMLKFIVVCWVKVTHCIVQLVHWVVFTAIWLWNQLFVMWWD
jgi:hypothetical protein